MTDEAGCLYTEGYFDGQAVSQPPMKVGTQLELPFIVFTIGEVAILASAAAEDEAGC